MATGSGCCAPPNRELAEDGVLSTAGCSTSNGSLTRRAGAVNDPLALMIEVPAGSFRMGSELPQAHVTDGEGPVRRVRLKAFKIDAYAVTNARFAAFVEATGYRTDAERFGWSYVFAGHLHPDARDDIIDGVVPGVPWWRGVRGATWRQPAGRGSSFEDILDHPVVHVSCDDAVAYATWASGRLPTEAEWECAARGGLDQAIYPWGDDLRPGGQFRANIWQGEFPRRNTVEDGFSSTAPVDAFAPNPYGLYNTAGNVWEWTSDWFSPSWHREARPETRVDPQGPPTGTGKVTKGGSFLCHVSYCNRYRVAARTQTTPDSTLSHCGFRLARDI